MTAQRGDLPRHDERPAAASPCQDVGPGGALRVDPPVRGRTGDSLREHPGGRRRLGRSGLASPWRTCADGCCLFLVGTVAAHAAAQWLRILRSSLAAEGHDLSGEVLVPGPGARPPVLLVVLAGEVVEAVLDVGA